MSSYGTDCESEINLAYANPTCDEKQAGIRQFALIHRDVISAITADPTNTDLWLGYINNGSIIQPIDCKGQKPKSSPTFGTGYRDQPQRLLSRTHTLSLTASLDINNYQFFNDLNLIRDYYLAYMAGDSGDRILFISKSVVQADSDDVIPESITDTIFYDIVFTWTHKDLNQAYSLPANIFAS